MRLLIQATLPLFLLGATIHAQADEHEQTQGQVQNVFTQVINTNAGFFDVREVHVERFDASEFNIPDPIYRDYRNDCSDLGRGGDFSEDTDKVVQTGDINLEQIVNTAKETWNFIKNNQPVVNATTQYAQALPRGSICWDDLENWQAPRSEYYKVTYNNGFGFEVVSLEFRLVYTYGGQVNNKGHFISNATIQYSKINVKWSFDVNAGVEVPLVVNVGTKEDPVAGMQMSIRWSIRSLSHIEQTASFFIYGDGRPTEVL